MITKPGRKKAAKLLAPCLAQGGRVLQAVGQWRPAATAYDAALACDGSRQDWQLELGVARETAGQWEQAAAAYEKAQRLTPTSELPEAQAGIARVCHKAQEEAGTSAARLFAGQGDGLPLTACFVPPPTTKNLASARIRCVFMSYALNGHYARLVTGSVGFAEDADIVVVNQICTARMLVRAAAAKAKGARIVYDACDPYADHHGAVYGIQAAPRFWNLIGLADAITVPTEAMRTLLGKLGVDKPIVVLPDTIDYQEQMNTALVAPTQSVIWFGNPGRGNLQSGLWALQSLKDRWGYAVTLMTAPSKISVPPEFRIEAWSYDGFVARLRAHGLALISQDPKAFYKSENRYLVAIANGVPAISTGSQSVAQLLQKGGFAEMNAADDRQLDEAMTRLQDPAYRSDYVSRMQRFVQDRFGPVAAGRRFVENVVHGALDVQFKGAKTAGTKTAAE